MTLAINILLWLVVCVLAVIAATRGRVLLDDGLRAGVMEFILLLPRIGIGVVGSGFVAEALPNAWIAPWLGPESGLLGIAIATLGGALTPGGPVVGFSIGAAALKSGAGAPQVIAYSTAWALYAIHRLVIWEVPMMPARVVPIEFGIDGRRRWARIPGLLDIEIEGIQGATPDGESWIDNVRHFVSRRLAAARASRGSYRDHGWDWNNAGRNGHYAPFDWQGP